MQVIINRGLHKAIRKSLSYFRHTFVSSSPTFQDVVNYNQWQPPRRFCIFAQGFVSGNAPDVASQHAGQYLLGSSMQRLQFCTETVKSKECPTEVVQELYQKIVESVEAETMPPNTWRDSLLENCKNQEDAKLAFKMLENLRRFKLANLRQNVNYNQQITLAVVSACIRANTPDLGLRTLWKHNVYGLTPCTGAAHSLLLYSKEQKNISLVQEILQTMEKNSMKLQPTTADIVFSIYNDTENWNLMCKVAKKFLQNGVKLHRGAYDIWISYAAKIGNTQQIWNIQELRLMAGLKHTIPSAFSCAKAYVLKCQPQEAAGVILGLFEENLSESKKNWINDQLEELVDKWPAAVIARRDKSHRKVFSIELKDNVAMMFNYLLNMGLNVSLNVEERFCSKASRSMDETLLC